MNKPARFKQADITRALAGAKRAGIEVRVEIDPSGKIVIMPTKAVDTGTANEWDAVLQ